MRHPVRIHPDVGNAHKASDRPLKRFARHQVFHRSAVRTRVQIEPQHLFPHGDKKTQLSLLTGIFLRDLQFDRFVGVLESAQQRRDGLAHLKINRPILDLNDDVVLELPIQRMKNVVGSPRAIILGIAPVQMMVINKSAVEQHAAMRMDRAGNYVGSIGR